MANDVRQIQALRLKERELEGEPSFDVYTNPSLQDKEGFQIVPRQGKQPSIVGLTQDSLKKLGAEAGLLGAIPEATISYYEEYDKNSYVTITYPIEEKNKVQDKGGNLIDSGTTTKKYITQRLRIPDIETKNFVRTRLKIPTTQSLQVNSNTPQAQGNQENNQVTQDQVIENEKQTIPGF